MTLLNLFLSQFKEFVDFQQARPQNESLGESLDRFRACLKKDGQLTDELENQIRCIYLHYTASLQMPDCPIIFVEQGLDNLSDIFQFDNRAAISLYVKNLDDPSVKELVTDYRDNRHPYIGAEISRVFHADRDYATAYAYLYKPLLSILNNPIQIWHDGPAVYGAALLLNMLVCDITYNIKAKLEEKGLMGIFLDYTYLFLSRVIKWPEGNMQSENSEGLSRNIPITFYHKRSCCLHRKNLLQKFSDYFEDKVPSVSSVGSLQVSDYYAAHEFSFLIVGDRGRKSEMKNYAKSLYESIKGPDVRPFYTAVEDGKIDSEELAYRFYLKYIRGSYSIGEECLVDAVSSILSGKLSSQNGEELKPDYKEIKKYLEDNNIPYFYHFTEAANIPNIQRYGGLLSQHQVVVQAIPNKMKAKSLSLMVGLRQKDSSYNLEDYARLSFCSKHPLISQRGTESKLVRLKIKTDIAFLRDTLFSDRDAAKEHHQGPGINDLKMVDFAAVSKFFPFREKDDSDDEYNKNMAEVMVKSYIPKEYIINLNNPDFL